MKRVCCVLAAAVWLLSVLTACGGDEPAKEIILADVYQNIIEAQTDSGKDALIFFEETDPEVLDSFYPGLSDIELVQQACYLPPVYGFACEIMMVETASKDDVRAVKDIFQARIDQAASDTAYPENAASWAQNAQVQEDGCCVCMIVLPDGYTIPENVFDVG